ncbi:MAG: hypothetical protein JOZ73_05440, partial [Solirubrobacterales bacterium]|nr:hypothetical protein [Solirubrobacterales bacterium]
TWNSATIPQNAIPIRIHGTPYILEFDEYAFRGSGNAPPDTVGAARLVNISDERHPYVVSNMRLEVDQPKQHHDASHDPGQLDPAQGYAAHYCNVPSQVNPQIVACSFISSGLRVFDIRDPYHPKETAYFVAPPTPNSENGGDKSNFAMSKPAFVPERREIWYSDGTSGFYALRVPKRVWPNPTPTPGQACLAASGKLRGRHVGPVRLGERRKAVRKRLPRYATRRRKSMDFYCLTGGGVRAGFPSRKLLRSLSRSQRRRVAGRVVLALTADRLYALRGIRPGTKLSKARGRLHPRRGLRIGLNTWYIVPGRVANGILKVRHGRIEEIGVVDKRLTNNQAAAQRVMSSFD